MAGHFSITVQLDHKLQCLVIRGRGRGRWCGDDVRVLHGRQRKGNHRGIATLNLMTWARGGGRGEEKENGRKSSDWFQTSLWAGALAGTHIMSLWAQYAQAIQKTHVIVGTIHSSHTKPLHTNTLRFTSQNVRIQFYKQQLQPSTSLHNIIKL